MRRRSLAVALIAALVLSLTGCLRYSAIYYIQSDGTVSGQIYTALKEGYQTNSDPYKGTGAGSIAAQFPGATVTDQSMGEWYGYLVSFSNAPLSSFSTAPSAAWDAQITKTGGVYKIVGYNTDSTTAETRDAITSNAGYSYLQIGFPGALKDAGNAASSGTTSGGSGWAQWDLVTMTGTPHAEGYGAVLTIDPGIYHFFPLDPTPGPVASPAPAPAPVVTVVVTPSAGPSPSPSESIAPSPSPTLTTIAAPLSGGSGGTPVALWIVLAALVVALAGLGGFMLFQRGRAAGVANAAAGGSGEATPPVAGDVADTEVMKAVDPKAVDPKPVDPKPGGSPKKLPPDVV
jgi:hypothetical protein